MPVSFWFRAWVEALRYTPARPVTRASSQYSSTSGGLTMKAGFPYRSANFWAIWLPRAAGWLPPPRLAWARMVSFTR